MRKSKIMPFVLIASVFSLSACDHPTWLNWLLGENKSEENLTPDAEKKSNATGGGWKGNVLTLDFTDGFWKSDVIEDYMSDNTTLYTYTYLGVTYNDKGSYIGTYDDKRWLKMTNKFTDGKVVEGETFAFIGNGSEYEGKTIKQVDVYVSSQTGGVDFVVDFSSSAGFTTSSTTGVKKQSVDSQKEVTISATAPEGSKYWSLSATKAVNQWRKNGGVDKIVITFN